MFAIFNLTIISSANSIRQRKGHFLKVEFFLLEAGCFANPDLVDSAKLPGDVPRGGRQGQVRVHRQRERQQEGQTRSLQRPGRSR